jgi:tRNA(fMet)-specific endonuclease VapC
MGNAKKTQIKTCAFMSINYLLDTTVCVHILRGKGDSILEKMSHHQVENFAISILTKFELLVGIKKHPSAQQLRRWNGFLDLKFAVIEFGEAEAEEAASVQAELESKGRGIGEIDTCLAGTARTKNLTVITSNFKEFSRIKRLRVEDWYMP